MNNSHLRGIHHRPRFFSKGIPEGHEAEPKVWVMKVGAGIFRVQENTLIGGKTEYHSVDAKNPEFVKELIQYIENAK